MYELMQPMLESFISRRMSTYLVKVTSIEKHDKAYISPDT